MSLSAQKTQKIKYELQKLIQVAQFKKVEKLYLKYKNQDMNDTDIWRYFATALSNRGDFTELANCCRKILNKAGDDFQARYALAVALQNTNQPDEAIRQYEKLIEIKPEYIDTRINLAQIMHATGNYTGALQQLLFVFSKQPNNEKALFMIAQCYYEQGNYIDSEKFYISFLALDKDNFNAINNLGRLYEETGKPEMAIEKFNHALTINNKIFITHLNLGKVLVKVERFREAKEEFIYAINIEPRHPEPYFNIGKLYNKKNETDIAKEYFLKALDADIQTHMSHADEFIHAVKFYLSNIDDPELFNIEKKEFVAELFDGYADKFDEHLIHGLQYKTPEIINALLISYISKKDNVTVDLGCGTGLCGKYLKKLSAEITGVDLSAAMIEKARELDLYDHLIVGEITEALNNNDMMYDLIIAADVFVYIASLKDIFNASSQHMKTDSFFIFSTELLEDELNSDYILFETGRYKHSNYYINKLISDSGFELIKHKFCTLRKENGKDVKGCVTILRKTDNQNL